MKTAGFFIALLLSGFGSFAQFKFYEQGIDAYKNQDYAKAIENLNGYLDYSIRDKSFDVDVHYYLGLSYFKTNSFTSSVREFDNAVQSGHKNAGNIYWFMAKAYGELRAPKESIESYSMALGLIPEHSNQSKILFERSQQYVKLGDVESAQKDLHQALTLNKDNGDAKQALALFSKKDNDIAKSEQKVTVTSPPSDRSITKGSKGNDLKKDSNKSKGELTLDNKNKVKQDSNSQVVLTSQSKVKNNPAEKKADGKNKQVIENQTVAQNSSDVSGKSNVQVTVPVVVEPKEPTLADLFKDEKRYALVIGNSNYKYVAPLKNAANDATDMAAELEKSNFEVIKVINGSYEQMREAYRKFHEKLTNGPKDQTIGLFYYAGHGLQNEGENYLVPVEANIRYEDDIPRACFAVQRVVVANMERSNSRMNIIILDACRNNPFPSAYRSGGAGLVQLNRAKGSFVAFATAPGAIASDGEGRNGLYTQELLKAMRKPARTIEQVFKDVRYNVMKLSEEKQYTWDQSNIIGDFYFKFQ